MSGNSSDLVSYSLELGERVLAKRLETQRKQNGQFFTPTAVARYMAQQLGPIRAGDRATAPFAPISQTIGCKLSRLLSLIKVHLLSFIKRAGSNTNYILSTSMEIAF
jgi:hypothetical protein